MYGKTYMDQKNKQRCKTWKEAEDIIGLNVNAAENHLRNCDCWKNMLPMSLTATGLKEDYFCIITAGS